MNFRSREISVRVEFPEKPQYGIGDFRIEAELVLLEQRASTRRCDVERILVEEPLVPYGLDVPITDPLVELSVPVSIPGYLLSCVQIFAVRPRR